MARRIQDMSDNELINLALDYADLNSDFNAHFIHKMEEVLDEYDELTTGQRESLERIVDKFNMLDEV